MTRSLSDLLREARATVPEVGPDGSRAARRSGRPAHRRARAMPSGTRATSRVPPMSAGATWSSRSRASAPDPHHPTRALLRRRHALAVRGADPPADGLHGRDVDERRLPGLEVEPVCRGPRPVVLSREQKQRYSRHLLIPEVGAEGQAKLLGSRALFIGAGGLGCAGPAVPRGGGRRHHRYRGLRRRRYLQPPAPGHPHHGPGRPEEDRVGGPDHPCPEPGRDRHPPRGDAHRRQRRSAHRGLRRDPRRHRHVRDALHPQRRRRPGAHPGGARLGVPVRGPAERVQAVRRPVLSLPVSHAAATRSWRPAARSRVSWASCLVSWGCSRPPRRSRCCWTSATRWLAGCSSTTPWTARSRSSSCGATRIARRAAMAPRRSSTSGVFTLGVNA